jgi:uncharacterized membrane protein
VSRTEPSRRRLAVVASLLAATGVAGAMLAARVVYTGSLDYANLAWNLVLAWVPFVLALIVYDRHRRGATTRALALPGALWLLFLPNAPYIVTDFFLLRWIDSAPVWYDIVLLTAFAWTGLALGFVSLFLVQSVARRLLGSAAGWSLALGALALSSFGVYLGRYLRWNSWDFVVQPQAVLADVWLRVADPLAYQKTLGMTVVFTGFLTVAYLVHYSWLALALQEDERSPA